MGAYSSWAAFSMTHHMLVHYAAFRCGIRDFKDYILLGDDIVINNDRVAQCYISLLTNLGVGVSLTKTHTSYNTYEFAKRWIRRGIEVSGVPLKGILLNLKYPQVVLQQLFEYTKRVRTTFNGSSLKMISILYDNLQVGSSKSKTSKSIRWTRIRMINYCKDFYLILRISSGFATDFELRQYFIGKIPDGTLLPSEKLISAFTQGLISITLDFQSERLARDVSTMFKDYIRLFNRVEPPKLKDQPLLHALFHKLKKVGNDVRLCYKSDNPYSLIKSIKDMRIEKVDKIVSEFRDPVIRVKGLDKL